MPEASPNKIVHIESYQKSKKPAMHALTKKLKLIRAISATIGMVSSGFAIGNRAQKNHPLALTFGIIAALAFGTSATTHTLLQLNQQLEDSLKQEK